MISQDLQDRLNALDAYIGQFDRTKTARDFWAGFEAIEGDLGEQAFAEDADPELLEQLTAILANADEAGFAAPLEILDDSLSGRA
jgi:hypothetical protein